MSSFPQMGSNTVPGKTDSFLWKGGYKRSSCNLDTGHKRTMLPCCTGVFGRQFVVRYVICVGFFFYYGERLTSIQVDFLLTAVDINVWGM